jgi:gluconate 5-dehydrogenase
VRSDKAPDALQLYRVAASPSSSASAAPRHAADLFSLRGRRALITGSGQGIGFTLARGLGAAGAELVLNDIDAERLKAAVERLESENIAATGLLFDVTNGDQVETALAGIRDSDAPIDILINNAGIHQRAPLESMSLAAWQAVINVNLTSAFLVTRAVVRGMLRQGSGKIINICSLNSEISRPTIANYSAAKGGLKMLTRAMAVEWGGRDIQANGIAPGYMRTAMTDILTIDPVWDRYICSRTPAGRWGDPAELIGAAVFLASPAASFVNGQILTVDGGLLAAL